MAHRMSFEIFQGNNQEWYWRLKAGNGQITAVSGEGYCDLWGAERAMKTLHAAAHAGRLPNTYTVTYAPGFSIVKSPPKFIAGIDHD